jgi:dTDP-4-amino-4,6-dideoxygalactose transaminase
VELAAAYTTALTETLVTPAVPEWAEPVWHLYVVRSARRNELQQKLTAAGVGSLVHYPTPPFRQQAYAHFLDQASRWPVADRLAGEVLSLPIGPQMDRATVAEVVAAVATG